MRRLMTFGTHNNVNNNRDCPSPINESKQSLLFPIFPLPVIALSVRVPS